MAASATFGRSGSAVTAAPSLPAVRGNSSPRDADPAFGRYSALSSSVISDTEALASPKSIDVRSP